MAEHVDQCAGAEPRLAQGWKQLCGTVIRCDRLAHVAQLLEGDSQAKMCIRVTRLIGNGQLQCRDGIRYTADLEAGETEIVLDRRIGWLQERGIAQRSDGIGWSPGLEALGGQGEQRRHLLRRGWVWRFRHGTILAWKLQAWRL